MNFSDAFSYIDGILIRKTRTSNRVNVGDSAGTIRPDGYLQVRFLGKLHLVHRIVWEMHNGPIPEGMEIDHINHIKTDNRIENLRVVDRAKNLMNRPMQNNYGSGVNGVDWSKSNRSWRARIRIGGREIHLGYFNKLDDAIEAREMANLKYRFHSNHGVAKC